MAQLNGRLGLTGRREVGASAVTLLGPATAALHLEAAARVGDQIWMAGGGGGSLRVIGFDVAASRVTGMLDVPGRTEVWGAATSGTDLYLATAAPAELVRIDTTTATVIDRQAVAARTAWSVTVAPDGEVLVGTADPAAVWSYHPDARVIRPVATVDSGPGFVRDLVATADHVYCGLGPQAGVARIDRRTGAVTEFDLPELEGLTFVRACAVVGSTLVLGTTPRATLVLVDLADPTRHEAVEIPHGEPYVTGLHVVGERLWITTTRSNLVWSIDRPRVGDDAAGRLQLLTVTPHAPSALGSLSDGRLWVMQDGLALVEPGTGQVTVPSLDLGRSHRFDATKALCWAAGAVYVSGESGVQVHAGDGEADVVTLDVTQVESLAATADRLYLGGPSQARITELPLGGTEPMVVGTLALSDQQRHVPVLAADLGRGLVVAGTRPDYGAREGALVLLDPATRVSTVLRGILPEQSVSAICPVADGWLVGGSVQQGDGALPSRSSASLALVRAADHTVTAESVPVSGATAVVDLCRIDDGPVVGITDQGYAFGFDLHRFEVMWRVRVARQGGRVTLVDRTVYGTDGRILWALQVDTAATPKPVTLLDGLSGVWSGLPAVVSDGRSTLFTLQENQLLRVDLNRLGH